MINRSKHVLFIITALFIFGSCKKFLEETPKGDLVTTNYYNNKDECLKAVYGVYNTFNNSLLTNLCNTLSIGTDEVFLPIPVPGGTIHGVYFLTTADTRILDYWRIFYAGIGNANLTISKIQSTNISDADKHQFIGELEFLRSYMYYYLTTLWGDVPFWTDKLDFDKVSVLGKTSRDSIFSNLLKDLNEAESFLPDTRYNKNGGRASKWSAKILKARIYLWQKDWAHAEKEANEVITNSSHVLLPNFGDVFREGNELNDEIIFAIEFKKDIQTNTKMTQWRPSPTYEKQVRNPGFFDGVSGYSLYQSFVDTYEPGDIRKKYTVFDYFNGTKLDFNWVAKVMRAPLPVDDPLAVVADAQNNTGLNDIYMRLADAYLMVAEAENNLNGPTAIAYNAINKVRARAKLPGLQGLSQDQFRKVIYDERGKEFSGENIGRKQDLIRWGILLETVKGLPAKEAIAQQNPFLTTQYKTKATFEAQAAATRIEAKHVFLPIPSTEIDKNPNLKQNPLWQ